MYKKCRAYQINQLRSDQVHITKKDRACDTKLSRLGSRVIKYHLAE